MHAPHLHHQNRPQTQVIAEVIASDSSLVSISGVRYLHQSLLRDMASVH